MINIKYRPEKLFFEVLLCIGLLVINIFYDIDNLLLNIDDLSKPNLFTYAILSISLYAILIIGIVYHSWVNVKHAFEAQNVLSVSGDFITINTLHQNYTFSLKLISDITFKKYHWGYSWTHEFMVIEISERVKPKFNPFFIIRWIFGTRKITFNTHMFTATPFELREFATEVIKARFIDRRRQSRAESKKSPPIRVVEGDDRFDGDPIISKHIQQSQGRAQPQTKPVFGHKHT
jgi:hypothetical protein